MGMDEDRKLLVERLRQLHQDMDDLLNKQDPDTARRLRKRYGLRACDNVPEPREDMSISEFSQLVGRYAGVMHEIEQLHPRPDIEEDADDFWDDDIDEAAEEPDDFDF